MAARAPRGDSSLWEREASAAAAERGAIVVTLIEGIGKRLEKIEESIISLARVEERHDALEKTLAAHALIDVENHRAVTAQMERIITLMDKLEDRVGSLERHRDVTVEHKDSSRYTWMFWVSALTGLAGWALVLVERLTK